MADDLETATFRTVAWRIVPLVCLLYVLNILDRANVGFARLAMQADLGLSQRAFDLGYGMFYVGYLLFEVPSNFLLRRYGARRWIARIMISWGLVSAATMLARDTTTFYALRILLGIAEAGFFPGIILYLGDWFPDRQRAKMTAFFMLAIGLSNVVGNPLSGWIMDTFDGKAGLHGWQWLFLLEGLPTALVGVGVLWWLDDGPQTARWLPAEQRDYLLGCLAREDAARRRRHGAGHWEAMLQPRVWWLIALYFTVAVGTNASGAYFPQLVKERHIVGVFDPSIDALHAFLPTLVGKGGAGAENFLIGLVTALPHLCAVVAMTVVGIASDRSGERRFHLAGAALVAAAGWGLTAAAPTPALALVGLCLAQAGMMSMLPVFWTIPATFLSGAAAAGGIALINSVANIGGFFGATILGTFGIPTVAALLVGGAILAALTRPEPPPGSDHGEESGG